MNLKKTLNNNKVHKSTGLYKSQFLKNQKIIQETFFIIQETCFTSFNLYINLSLRFNKFCQEKILILSLDFLVFPDTEKTCFEAQMDHNRRSIKSFNSYGTFL